MEFERPDPEQPQVDMGKILEERDRIKTRKVRVDELQERTTYEVNEDCPITQYPGGQRSILEKGTHFSIQKRYDDYSHVMTTNGIHFSVSNAEVLPILGKEFEQNS